MKTSPDTKTCLLCERELPATTDYFHKAPNDYLGLHRHCKECRNARRRDMSRTDPEYAEKNRMRSLRWRTTNLERARDKARAYAASHRTEAVERVRQWREVNPERYKESCTYAVRREHFRSNRDYYLAIKHNHRARKAGINGVLSGDEISGLYLAQEGVCAYCGEDMGAKYTVDHILPMSRGGENSIVNIALCCSLCNTSKHKDTPEEWEQRRTKR